jgi:hypothetical protein
MCHLRFGWPVSVQRFNSPAVSTTDNFLLERKLKPRFYFNMRAGKTYQEALVQIPKPCPCRTRATPTVGLPSPAPWVRATRRSHNCSEKKIWTSCCPRSKMPTRPRRASEVRGRTVTARAARKWRQRSSRGLGVWGVCAARTVCK